MLGYADGPRGRQKAIEMPKLPSANLLVVERQEGPAYYAKWRRDGWQVKRRLGPAWIERGDAAKAERRRTRHDGWIKRRGRVEEGYLTEDDAVGLIPGAIAEHEAEQTRARDEQAKEAEREMHTLTRSPGRGWDTGSRWSDPSARRATTTKRCCCACR